MGQIFVAISECLNFNKLFKAKNLHAFGCASLCSTSEVMLMWVGWSFQNFFIMIIIILMFLLSCHTMAFICWHKSFIWKPWAYVVEFKTFEILPCLYQTISTIKFVFQMYQYFLGLINFHWSNLLAPLTVNNFNHALMIFSNHNSWPPRPIFCKEGLHSGGHIIGSCFLFCKFQASPRRCRPGQLWALPAVVALKTGTVRPRDAIFLGSEKTLLLKIVHRELLNRVRTRS